jgi:hypothetical protein
MFVLSLTIIYYNYIIVSDNIMEYYNYIIVSDNI